MRLNRKVEAVGCDVQMLVAIAERANFFLYQDCELFQIGVHELGLLGDPAWYECELFQVGLKELGLVAA